MFVFDELWICDLEKLLLLLSLGSNSFTFIREACLVDLLNTFDYTLLKKMLR